MTVAFVFLASMTLLCSLGVVLSRSVVRSALFMSGAFLGVAGFYVMLNSPVLAAFQVLIYVGAVTVVILFGIMFTQKPQARRFGAIFNGQLWPGVLVAAGVGAFLVYVVSAQGWAGKAPGNGPRDAAELGRILLGVAGGGSEVFALLFVLASVLLMVALVAAIVISYRKHAPASPEEDDVFVGRDRTASREEGALDGLPGPASPPEGSPPLVHRDS